MPQQVYLQLPHFRRGIHLVTKHILEQLPPLPEAGILHLFIRHTSAALALNENADPDVRRDLERALDELAPEHLAWYTHTLEGSDDMPAHIKAVMVGSSLSIPITHGSLGLGTWQGVFLCEFRDQAGSRTVVATVLP